MDLINEGSEFTITAAPRDADNLPITPTAMRYRIDCLATGTQVLDWTAIAVPAETNDIIVPGSLTTIIDSCSTRERKQMVIETTNGSNVRNDTIDWEVRNIYGVR